MGIQSVSLFAKLQMPDFLRYDNKYVIHKNIEK